MSHFTVLIPAKDEDELEQKLLPFHEYESTGINQFAEWIPADNDEVGAAWAKYGPDGSDPDDGLHYATYAEFMRDHFGYRYRPGINGPGTWGRYTNPQARWDWWVVGGRWSGKLPLKPEYVGHGTQGEGGVMNEANTDPACCDSALAGQIDWNAYRDALREGARKKWRLWRTRPAVVKGNEQSEAAFRQWSWDNHFLMLNDNEEKALGELDEDAYAAQVSTEAVTFAFIDLNGDWYEEARMGWWAFTSDNQDGYDARFWRFVESLPADQRVWVIDAHI